MKVYVRTAIKDIPKANKGGDCYQVAYRTFMEDPHNRTLVHAVVTGQGPIEGISIWSCFCYR